MYIKNYKYVYFIKDKSIIQKGHVNRLTRKVKNKAYISLKWLCFGYLNLISK